MFFINNNNNSKKLTIICPNRNRLDFNKNPSVWFLNSLKNQYFKDFEVIIVDGGSDNIIEIESYIKNNCDFVRVIKENLKEKKMFHKTFLNNIGIKNSTTEYIATTDADMFFGKDFLNRVNNRLHLNVMVESRVIYWEEKFANMIYRDIDNIHKDISFFQKGKHKKRTTCGGFQCLHKEKWELLNGYDERYIGWGGEDRDLLQRAINKKINIKWLGEQFRKTMLFHQPHFFDEKLNKKTKRENHKLLKKIKLFSMIFV